MKDDQSQRLNKLNYDFYEKIGKYWNNSPDYEWDGWVRCRPFIKQLLDKIEQINVLDLGCGNGRFYNYLIREFGEGRINYTGVDFSDFLLTIGVENTKNLKARFIKKDLFFSDWDFSKNNYDLVVSFGLIHHIPGQKQRDVFFEKLNETIKTNTLGVITSWNYRDINRINNKIIENVELGEGFDENDKILYWDKHEYGERFSRYYTEEEMLRLLKGMEILDFFKEDDKKRIRNSYYIFRKKII